jgi:WD40-like Beta Propeller Repeat
LSSYPLWSPDGRSIAFSRRPTLNLEAEFSLLMMASDGANPQMVVEKWGWLYYLPDHENLYRVPGPAQHWRAAAPEKLTDFSLTFISFIENPQLSRDGTQLAYSRGRIASDIWLMTMRK